MEPGNPNGALHDLGMRAREADLNRKIDRANIRKQVREIQKAQHSPLNLAISRMIDSALAYELIGSVASLAILSVVLTVVL